MKRLGIVLILALCGCQTSGDVEEVGSPAGPGSNLTGPGNESCGRSRVLLNKYYLTPHQREDLLETMRTNGCGDQRS